MAVTTFTTPLDAALFYAARGMLVFPTDRESKKPLITGWQEQATTDAIKVREFFARFPGCNFGVRLRENEVVIDLDRKNEVDGVSEMQGLCIKLGIALRSTFTVTTPTGGQHLYFSTTKKLSLSVGKLGPGIDIRTEGGYVIGAGCSNSLGSYRIEEDSGPVLLPIPDQFVSLLQSTGVRRLHRPDDSDVIASIKAHTHDNELTRWAGLLRGQGLVTEEILGALRVINDIRCDTPTDDAAVVRIANSIGKKPRGTAAAIADFATDTIPTVKLTSYNGKAIKARKIPAPDQILENFFDTGDVVGVFGKSKAKKSWFMANLGLCVATGIPFLHWAIPKTRKVVLYQLEVKRDHFETRIQKMTSEMDKGVENFEVLHCRGMSLSAADISADAKARGAEVVLIDPIYPLFPNGENNAEDVRPIVQEFGRMAEAGITVVYAMHDAKGRSGDRELVDRGSGSGIIGRAYDAAFFLDPHSDEDEAIVVRAICRNYRAYPDLVANFLDNGTFSENGDLEATPKTSFSENKKKNSGPPLSEVSETVFDAIPEEGTDRASLWSNTGIGRNKIDAAIKILVDQKRVETCQTGKNHRILIKKSSLSGDISGSEDFLNPGSVDDLV